MLLYKNRIVVTGGTGRFGSELKKIKTKYKLLFPTKQKLNILKLKTIDNYLKKRRPKYLLHLAGLSRPMKIHEKDIDKSIDLNIIGTANITKACSKLGIKLIYFSTSYIYPGTRGNYKETDPLLPKNNYSWSKLGGGEREHDHDTLVKRINEHKLPEDAFQWYLDLRKYGTVPHSGFGLGVERTVSWICGITHLREAIPFPRMINRLEP